MKYITIQWFGVEILGRLLVKPATDNLVSSLNVWFYEQQWYATFVRNTAVCAHAFSSPEPPVFLSRRGFCTSAWSSCDGPAGYFLSPTGGPGYENGTRTQRMTTSVCWNQPSLSLGHNLVPFPFSLSQGKGSGNEVAQGKGTARIAVGTRLP